jgi:RES domain-containing protein
MFVYRILLTEYAGALIASGNEARWNKAGSFVIYAAGSRSLACLENLVHRSGKGLSQLFSIQIIEIPASLPILTITPDTLPPDWQKRSSYPYCQQKGMQWYEEKAAAVLEVPSSIIPEEFNVVINTRHPDFKLITLKGVERFGFDDRLKVN